MILFLRSVLVLKLKDNVISLCVDDNLNSDQILFANQRAVYDAVIFLFRLYIRDYTSKLTRDPTDPESTQKLYEHLNTGRDGSCGGKTGYCVTVMHVHVKYKSNVEHVTFIRQPNVFDYILSC